MRSVSTRGCTPKESYGRIHFDCHISNENYETLIQDMQYLRRMSLQGPAGLSLQQELHLTDSSGESLFHWFEEKIQFLLDESFEIQSRRISATNMSNLLLYFHRNPYAVIEVPGFGPVEINSQRVGVILFGTGFFRTYARDGFSEETSDRINRLSALIHEARHNEGRGTSFGFPHSLCPDGHSNAGRSVCDACSNGAYAIETLFLESALAGCDQCNDLEGRLLRHYLASAREKTLPEAILCEVAPELP